MRTVVAAPEGQAFINTTGNAGMATGGSGDVLAGMIGGLIAQGLRPLPAAAAGVFLHGKCGDFAAQIKSQRGLVAGDILEAIPAVWLSMEG
jgi:NAD(P)H-hydrate epimerase